MKDYKCGRQLPSEISNRSRDDSYTLMASFFLLSNGEPLHHGWTLDRDTPIIILNKMSFIAILCYILHVFGNDSSKFYLNFITSFSSVKISILNDIKQTSFLLIKMI